MRDVEKKVEGFSEKICPQLEKACIILEKIQGDGNKIRSLIAKFLKNMTEENQEKINELLLESENQKKEDPLSDLFAKMLNDFCEDFYDKVFTFQDIVMLDNRSVQKVLQEVSSIVLAKAIKGEDEEVQNKIFNNISKRVGEKLERNGEILIFRESNQSMLF